MVHQHFMLIPVMTVAENIVLAARADARRRPARPRRGRTTACASSPSGSGSRSTRSARIEDITVGQQQRVEILKALYRKADILILDEPTAVLTPQEARELFEIIRGLTAQGKSIIFISHKLNEVTRDRRPDHRAAPRQDDRDAARARARPRQSLARLMVGREVLLRVEKGAAEPERAAARGRATCTCSTTAGIEKVRGVSFEVRAGEIVGIAGIDGNGQTELIDAMTGLRQADGGQRRRSAAKTSRPTAPTAHFDGRASATSRRTGSAAGSCSSSRSPRTSRCTTTASAPDSRFGWLFPSRLIERAARLIKEFDVRGGGPADAAPAASRAATSRRSCSRARSTATQAC